MEGTVQKEKKLVGKLSKGGSAMGSLKDFKGERGDPGVYVGSGDMPDDCYVQIDPSGNCFTPEDLNSKLDKVDFIPAPPGVAPAAQYANQAYEAYGYADYNGNYHQFNAAFSNVPTAPGYTDSSTIPMIIMGDRPYLVSTGKSPSEINPQMKLIASGTTTEEVAAIVITETNDNGMIRPIKVTERISVFMTIPKASGTGYAYLQINPNSISDGTITAAHGGVSSSNANTYVRHDAFYCGGGLWSAYSASAASGTSWHNPGTRPLNMDFPKGEVVTNITLKAQYPFPVGTKYLVCGIEV